MACTRISWQKVNHVSVPTLIIQVRVLRFCSMRLECFSLKCNVMVQKIYSAAYTGICSCMVNAKNVSTLQQCSLFT